MVVEDEPDIYDLLLAMFEIWGIEGVAFVDGSDAIAWIEDVDAGRVRSDLPELAILDIRLPDIDGHEVAARLRKSPVLGNIAIVLITAYHMPPKEEAEVMRISQADLLLYKPLPVMSELREAMSSVIAKHKGAKETDRSVASSELTSVSVQPQADSPQRKTSSTAKPKGAAKETKRTRPKRQKSTD